MIGNNNAAPRTQVISCEIGSLGGRRSVDLLQNAIQLKNKRVGAAAAVHPAYYVRQSIKIHGVVAGAQRHGYIAIAVGAYSKGTRIVDRYVALISLGGNALKAAIDGTRVANNQRAAADEHTHAQSVVVIDGAGVNDGDAICRIIWDTSVIFNAQSPAAMRAGAGSDGAGINHQIRAAIAAAIDPVAPPDESEVDAAEIVPLLFNVMAPPSAHRNIP